jgi:3-keto-5-aminohexanoate cleavage enzyme
LTGEQPVVVTAALTGAITERDRNPNLPITVEENVNAAIEAWQAGASVVHIHARAEDGEPSQHVEHFAPIVEGIRAANCDVILNLTTGSAAGRFTGADRYQCLALRPEMASFDCGSMNFGERVFENSMAFLRDLAEACDSAGAKPEIEVFDVGQIGNALRLRDEGLLHDPLHFQFVLGVQGGAPATVEQVQVMRTLIPDDATWSICALGRTQLPLNVLALITDGHVRTGLEDNIYYRRGILAESNAQLVRRVVRIAEELGRPVATPAQAREALSLRQPTLQEVAP